MLKQLKFVAGAVAKKDFLPAMTHFRIEKGHVRAFNGFMAISSPIPLDIDCTPKADSLIRAIGHCEETVTLNMTPTGKLSVKSGRFRAFIDTIDGPTPHVEPAGDVVNFDGELLLKAFKTLVSFVGNDASRPWVNGILLKGKSAFATNNVCLVEYWLGVDTPVTVNIPLAAIHEMLRVDEAPIHAQMDKNSVTFHYTDGRWIRTQLLEIAWPDRINDILSKTCTPSPVDERLFNGLEMLSGFADSIGRVYIKNGELRTHIDNDIGATYEADGLAMEGLYQIKMLTLLKGVATHVDFTLYPEPAIFYGENLRGAIIGMRM